MLSNWCIDNIKMSHRLGYLRTLVKEKWGKYNSSLISNDMNYELHVSDVPFL